HVAHDVEAAWEEVGPYVANDRASYGAWAAGAGIDTGHREVTEDHGLRDDPEYLVLTPEQCRRLLDDLGPTGTLPLNPMMGGIPPELAWRSLELFATEVMARD
ncbi:MAG: LLM class flavin-dependent oxidoreductase, partial [Microthrixaceae bacterium]